MELFALIIGLFFLVTIFMPWVNHSRFGSVRLEIERLQRRVRELEGKVYSSGQVGGQKAQPLKQSQDIIQAESDAEPYAPVSDKPDWKGRYNQVLQEISQEAKKHAEDEVQSASVPRASQQAPLKKGKSTFEQNIATKLPVWIGSISLIFAAFFLVKYSMEFGLLGPLARVGLGGLFGFALLGTGQFVSKKPEMPNAIRISQGLIGAGLVALYVSLYAAIHLYGLISPVLGFGGMTMVTALAVILSLRHGQTIAIFGLLGGLLTPALVGSDAPNALALFTYLFLLFSGLFIVLVRKGWWMLAITALLGVFSWSAFWFMHVFSASDAFILLLFAMALTSVVLVATGKRIADGALKDHEENSVSLLNVAAISGGVLTIVLISLEITLGLFDWAMLGLLSLALMALTYFKQDVYHSALFVKLGVSLILFFFWVQDASLTEGVFVIAGISAVYIGVSAFVMRQVTDPRLWSVLQVVAALSLYLISYWSLDLPFWITQSFEMFWGVLALVLASLSIYQAADIRAKYKADDVIQKHLVATYSLAASAFISLALAIELPWAYLPLAIAGQVAATAWVYHRTGIDFLKYIMYILTLVFVAMNYEQVLLFGSIILHSLADDIPSTRSIGSFVLDAPLVKLGIPSLLMYLSLLVVMRMDKSDQKLIHALFGTANILALFTAYYMFRDFFHAGAGHIFSSETGFIERGIITMTLAGVGVGIIEFIRKHDVEFLKPWGVGIFRMAMIRFVYFDFFLHNPYWSSEQFVGNLPIINGITLTYGFGLIAVVWAIQNKDLIAKTDTMRKLYGAIAFAALFAVTSLNVRQYFHGGFLEQGGMSSAELYAYSVIWLITGLAFLTVGIKFQNKAARMVSIAFIALAVFKVFLFDAAELEGLYRVFSFLGLGVSLIGLSYFYTRFVLDAPKGKEIENA